MAHTVLLGDSIFDNAAYTRGGPDVIRQLRETLPPDGQATLLAVDGDITTGVVRQLRGLPADATHLVVSVGGNDALGHSDILNRSARSFAEVLNRLAEMQQEFERDYRAMLRAVAAPGLPAAVCTVYYPRFPDAVTQRLTSLGLTVFNDVILRLAAEAGLPVLDLRLICDQDEDYANPIEPSSHGGAKIARAIAGLLAEHDWGTRRTAVYVR